MGQNSITASEEARISLFLIVSGAMMYDPFALPVQVLNLFAVLMYLCKIQRAKILIVPLIFQFFVYVNDNSIGIAGSQTWSEPVAVPIELIYR